MLTKIRTVIVELGLWWAALYALDRLCRQVRLPLRVYAYDLVAQPVASEPILRRSPRRPLTLRETRSGDPALREMPLTPEVAKFRFEQGAVCLTLFESATPVGYLWFCFGAYDEDEVRCRYIIEPSESTVWDFDVYLTPEKRAGFAFVRLWDAANAWLCARGRNWTISRISAFNRASIAAHKRVGAQTLGWAVFFCIGSLQVLVSNLAPWLHVSRRSRPRIRLTAPTGDARRSAYS